MSTLDVDDIHSLEQLRQRLQQLHNSLNSLQYNIAQSDPLPPWASLQSQFSIISNNLQSVAKQLSEHQDLYSSTFAYPLPNFPGRTQDNVLQGLLRTRLEPNVEDWIERGSTVAEETLHPDAQGKPSSLLRDLWEWAPGAANEEARTQNWGADYTLAEVESGVESVVTGLKRKLVVPEETESGDEDEDEGDTEEAVEEEDANEEDVEMVGVRRKSGAAGVEFDISKTTIKTAHSAAPMPLDSIFRYAMTGAIPSGTLTG